MHFYFSLLELEDNFEKFLHVMYLRAVTINIKLLVLQFALLDSLLIQIMETLVRDVPQTHSAEVQMRLDAKTARLEPKRKTKLLRLLKELAVSFICTL